jgi:hypothetical protein
MTEIRLALRTLSRTPVLTAVKDPQELVQLLLAPSLPGASGAEHRLFRPDRPDDHAGGAWSGTIATRWSGSGSSPGTSSTCPHLHLSALDGAWREDAGELGWEGLGHLRTSEVGEVLKLVVRRMEKHLGWCAFSLKKAYSDGTITVDMDPLSLLLPAGLKRAPAAVPHREVRGGAGSGKPVEVASGAAIAPSRRRGRQAGPAGSRGRLPPVG